MVCWIEGNNHKYEGKNERENSFTYQYMFQYNLLWGVHLSINFFEVVCLLVDMIGNRTTHIWVEFKKTSVHPFVGYHLLHPWYSPIYYTPCYHFYIFLDPLYISFPPYDDKGAASTCKPAEKQNKPETPVWLPTFWACKAQKTWFEPMISSKEIKIQQTWFYQCFIKKISIKKQKIQRP